MVATLKKIIPQWNKKKLKNWVEKDLSELNKFLIETQKKLKTEKNTEIELLIKFLKEIAKFQDKNLEKIKNLKRSLKDENKSKALAEFEDVLFVCGRDYLKTKKHKSSVENKNAKKHHLTENMYLKEKQFHTLPQPLNKLKDLSDADMYYVQRKKAAEDASRNFLLENLTSMMTAIADFR